MNGDLQCHTPLSPGQQWRKAEWETRSYPRGHSRGFRGDERCLSPCVYLRVSLGDPCQVRRCDSQADLAHVGGLGPTPPPAKPSRTGDRSKGGIKAMGPGEAVCRGCHPDPTTPGVCPSVSSTRPDLPLPSLIPLPSPRPAALNQPLGSSCVSSAAHPGRSGAFSGASYGPATPGEAAILPTSCRQNGLQLHARPPSILHAVGDTKQLRRDTFRVVHARSRGRQMEALAWHSRRSLVCLHASLPARPPPHRPPAAGSGRSSSSPDTLSAFISAGFSA